MKLIDNARDAWKFACVHAMTAAIALQGAWLSVPEDLRDDVPKNLVHAVTIALLVLGIIGRLIKQSPTEKGPP